MDNSLEILLDDKSIFFLFLFLFILLSVFTVGAITVFLNVFAVRAMLCMVLQTSRTKWSLLFAEGACIGECFVSLGIGIGSANLARDNILGHFFLQLFFCVLNEKKKSIIKKNSINFFFLSRDFDFQISFAFFGCGLGFCSLGFLFFLVDNGILVFGHFEPTLLDAILDASKVTGLMLQCRICRYIESMATFCIQDRMRVILDCLFSSQLTIQCVHSL